MAENTKYLNPGTASHENLKVGDRLSYTSYLEIAALKGSNLTVKDERGVIYDIIQSGAGFTFEQSMVNKLMHSASQINDTKVVTRRQPDPVVVFDQIKSGNKLRSHAEQKKLLKEGMKGETRVLIGHLLGTDEHNMGRTLVVDLEAKEPRLVDHRTIDKLVLRGIEYVVKK